MLFKHQILEALFLKIGALKNFTKIIGKYLYQSLFLLKLQAYSCNFIKKEASAMVCSWEFCKTFKNTFFIEHLQMTASEIWLYVSMETLTILVLQSKRSEI